MEQDTTDLLRLYAELFFDLRAISSDFHYYLTPDRLKGLEADYRRLNGLLKAVEEDADKEGIKRMLWSWISPEWPLLLAVKKRDMWVRWMLTQTTRPQEELEARVDAFKGVLAEVNSLTTRIAGAIGLAVPIDPVEAGKFFKPDFVRSKNWGRYLAELHKFREGNPGKQEIALVAYYIKGTKWASGARKKNVARWMRDFFRLLGAGDCSYNASKLGAYIDLHPEKYKRLIDPFRRVLS